MRSWLARLSYSFIIIGLWLAWEAYVSVSRRGHDANSGIVILYVVGGALNISLGVQGIKARHRRD